MNNIGLDDFINAFESFCKKRKLEYIHEERGVAIKSATGEYNIHIYMKWSNVWGETQVVVGFIIGDNIYHDNSSRCENNLGFVNDMSLVTTYLNNTYSEWLSRNRYWKSRSKYK